MSNFARGSMSACTFALRSVLVTHSGKQSLDAEDTEGPVMRMTIVKPLW